MLALPIHSGMCWKMSPAKHHWHLGADEGLNPPATTGTCNCPRAAQPAVLLEGTSTTESWSCSLKGLCKDQLFHDLLEGHRRTLTDAGGDMRSLNHMPTQMRGRHSTNVTCKTMMLSHFLNDGASSLSQLNS